MSTFATYLTESTKTYEYKVKIAGDIDKDFATRMETCLQKFEVAKMSAGKKTPIQSLPLDFPALTNLISFSFLRNATPDSNPFEVKILSSIKTFKSVEVFLNDKYKKDPEINFISTS